MESDPVFHAGFVAPEQGFEAIEPGIGVFDEGAEAAKFGVKESVIVGFPVRGAGASNVGFNVTSNVLLAERLGIEALSALRYLQRGGRTRVLNLELAKVPSALLEYVVVHELIYLLEWAHNERFRALLDQYCPAWRRCLQELNCGDLTT